MLILRRKVGEEILIDGRITVKVNRIEGYRVSLAIDAPDDVRILRGELVIDLEEEEAEPVPAALPLNPPAHHDSRSLPTVPR